MVFRSRVDGWLVWLVRLAVLAAVVLTILLIVRERSGLTVAVLALLLLVYGIAEWMLGRTYYMVDQDFLRIRSGPFRSRMLISDIQTISRSVQRLEIRDGNGRIVHVRPTDDELFVEALRSVNGKIEVVSR